MPSVTVFWKNIELQKYTNLNYNRIPAATCRHPCRGRYLETAACFFTKKLYTGRAGLCGLAGGPKRAGGPTRAGLRGQAYGGGRARGRACGWGSADWAVAHLHRTK